MDYSDSPRDCFFRLRNLQIHEIIQKFQYIDDPQICSNNTISSISNIIESLVTYYDIEGRLFREIQIKYLNIDELLSIFKQYILAV